MMKDMDKNGDGKVTGDELRQVEDLPDVLGAVGLLQSRMALTYALGHEAALRADGRMPHGVSGRSCFSSSFPPGNALFPLRTRARARTRL